MTKLGRRSSPSESTARPDGAVPVSDARREMWRQARHSTIRVVLVTTMLVLMYSFAPLGRRLDPGVVIELTGVLVLIVLVTAWEFRTVTHSKYPEVRAVEAVGVILPLLLLPFSAAYFVTAQQNAGSFSESLSRLDAFYFTLTTFATVGYGDIVAKSEVARAMVTVQMLVDLVLIGFIAKALLTAAQRRRKDLSGDGSDH